MRPVYLTTTNASGAIKSSPVCPPDLYISPFQVTLRTKVTGAVVYDVRYTNDDVFSPTFDPTTADWTVVTGMDDAVANAEATLISGVRGIQLVQASGAGSVTLEIVQSGR